MGDISEEVLKKIERLEKWAEDSHIIIQNLHGLLKNMAEKYDDELLTTKQAAIFVNRKEITLRKRKEQGLSPKVTWVGKKPMYKKSDLIDYLKSNNNDRAA